MSKEQVRKKYAACSVVNKKYLRYLEVFSYSLIRMNPSFDSDYIVFYLEGDLISEDFDRLRRIYSGFIFKKINTANYSNVTPAKAAALAKRTRIGEWTYYRLEQFTLEEYDQVFWFDVDMLVLKNLDDLFNMRNDDKILACEDLIIKSKHKSPGDEKQPPYILQGGVNVVGKNLLNKKIYNDLISLLQDAYKYDRYDRWGKTQSQSLYAEYFGDSGRIKHINPMFNLNRKIFVNTITNKFEVSNINAKDVYILHYPGSKKPIDLKNNTYIKKCSSFIPWHKADTEMEVVVRYGHVK